MIPGIDVSHWQGEIDWAAVKRSGVKFAFIKASEFPDKRNSLFVDNRLKENVVGAKTNGILWSAYHFFRTHIDPVIQAQMFCSTVGSFDSLPPVIDLEVAGSRGTKLNDKVRKFVLEVERITYRKPIIYTSGSFWRSYMCYEKKSDSDWARDYPLWLAQYTTLWPTPCYPWAGWDIWQYTDKGRIPGLKGAVDMNWFNGSYEELKKRFLPGNAKNVELGQTVIDKIPEEVMGDINYSTTNESDSHSIVHGDYMEDSFIKNVFTNDSSEIQPPSVDQEIPVFQSLRRRDIFTKLIEKQHLQGITQTAQPVIAAEQENWIIEFYKNRTEIESGEYKSE